MGSLFLARHSITAASASGRNLGQASDPPLADAGVALASALASAIVAEMEELPHDELRLISSPALRCRQTAEAIARGLRRDANEIAIEPGLVEIDYGAWEGLSDDESRDRYPELRAAWDADPYVNHCPAGESGADVAARCLPIFREIEGWLAERSRCAIVVAHNHVNRVRICELMGWRMSDYRRRVAQDPGAYSMFTYGGNVPVVRRMNAAASL